MPKKRIRLLIVTNMYPSEKSATRGVFVKETVDALREGQVDVDLLAIMGRRTAFKYAIGVFRLWWRLARNKYDLIHAYYVYSGIVGRLQLLCPVVLTLCGSDVNLRSQRSISRWLSRRVSATIVQSPKMKELLGDEAAIVLPFGVNLSLFAATPKAKARSQLGLRGDRRFALFPYEPGRKEKRYSLFTAAVDKARETEPGLESLVLENLPRDQVPLYMSAADVMVLTSEAEGSPMSVKEALACGLPIVSVDVGDVRELISNVDGCYVCEDSPHAIGAGILQALSFGDRTEGRERVTELSSRSTAARLVSLYEELLQDR